MVEGHIKEEKNLKFCTHEKFVYFKKVTKRGFRHAYNVTKNWK